VEEIGVMCANLYAFVFTFDTDVRDLVSNRKLYCSGDYTDHYI